MGTQNNPPRDGTIVVKKTTIEQSIQELEKDKSLTRDQRDAIVEGIQASGDKVETTVIREPEDGLKHMSLSRAIRTKRPPVDPDDDAVEKDYQLNISIRDANGGWRTAILAVDEAPNRDKLIDALPVNEQDEMKPVIGYGKELTVLLSSSDGQDLDLPVKSVPVCEAFKGAINAVLTGTLTGAEASKLDAAKKLIEQSAGDGYSATEIKAIVAAFDAVKKEGLKGL